MRTVLIAHGNAGFASQLAATLSGAGYRAITQPGPWPPARRCLRCDLSYCPVTEAADIAIYDPDLTSIDAEGYQRSLVLETGRSHPEVPVLLAWSGDVEPPSVADVLAQLSSAQRAATEPDELIGQIRQLIGHPLDPTPNYGSSAADGSSRLGSEGATYGRDP